MLVWILSFGGSLPYASITLEVNLKRKLLKLLVIFIHIHFICMWMKSHNHPCAQASVQTDNGQKNAWKYNNLHHIANKPANEINDVVSSKV